MTVHLLYYKIVHHFTLPVDNFWLQPVAKMLRHSETTGKPDFFLPPSLHRSKSCSTKFKAWTRNFEKGGGGGGHKQWDLETPYKLKRGTVCSDYNKLNQLATGLLG